MVVGKNKNLKKKKSSKKAVDVFLRKEWYVIKAPTVSFANPNVGRTCVNKTQGTRISSDSLKGRVYEVNLGDLNKDEENSFRKIKLQCQDVQGRNCLTSFYGMDMTTDKAKSLIRKNLSLIEAHVDCRTTDGVQVRIFVIAFTKRRLNQVRKTSFAQTSQIRNIRRKMVDIVTREATTCDLKDLVAKFIPEKIGREIEKSCNGIYPLQNVYVRKCKVLKQPKLDVTKFMELHSDKAGAGTGIVKTRDFSASKAETENLKG